MIKIVKSAGLAAVLATGAFLVGAGAASAHSLPTTSVNTTTIPTQRGVVAPGLQDPTNSGFGSGGDTDSISGGKGQA